MVDTKPLQTNFKGPAKAKKAKQPDTPNKSSSKANKGQRSSGRR
jgi:hypothetical protein